jgi:hypothetical protein
MAEIGIMPLDERLSEEEIVELAAAMEELGAPRLPRSTDDAATTVADNVDDELLAEFLDRLEAHDIACDIYLPVEFDGCIDVSDVRVGSAHALIDVLDEMRDELFTDDDDDEEEEDDDEEEDEEDLLEGKLRHVWKLFYTGAQNAVDRHLPLHVQS